jgi:hypothetical protein
MAETFEAPQPFNVEIVPEQGATPHVAMPVLGPALPVVAQEITPDRDLYTRQRHGMRPGVVRYS